MRRSKTKEDKVAEKIATDLDSSTLNLDEVGRYFARMPTIYYNRLMVVAESAEWEKVANGYDKEEGF
jgi:hypothetical protein